jgi:hypothetical protein
MTELSDYDDKILDPEWYKTREDLEVVTKCSAETPVHRTPRPLMAMTRSANPSGSPTTALSASCRCRFATPRHALSTPLTN